MLFIVTKDMRGSRTLLQQNHLVLNWLTWVDLYNGHKTVVVVVVAAAVARNSARQGLKMLERDYWVCFFIPEIFTSAFYASAHPVDGASTLCFGVVCLSVRTFVLACMRAQWRYFQSVSVDF